MSWQRPKKTSPEDFLCPLYEDFHHRKLMSCLVRRHFLEQTFILATEIVSIVNYWNILPEETLPYLLSVVTISPDKARKGVIYPLKTGIYALVGISERTFTRQKLY